jgi:hypothetical protein
MHESLVDNLKQNSDLSLEERESSWFVCIRGRAGYRFEIVIPKNVPEWRVDAYDDATGEKVWSNWSDWYSIKGDPPEQELPLLCAEDVKYFISRLLSADAFRFSQSPGIKVLWWTIFSTTRLEGKIGGVWCELEPGTLPDNADEGKNAAD